MDDAALDRFLMHYERLTRWMLEEMPAQADVVIAIGADQRSA
jgi:D-glycerate 3-kinase